MKAGTKRCLKRIAGARSGREGSRAGRRFSSPSRPISSLSSGKDVCKQWLKIPAQPIDAAGAEGGSRRAPRLLDRWPPPSAARPPRRLGRVLARLGHLRQERRALTAGGERSSSHTARPTATSASSRSGTCPERALAFRLSRAVRPKVVLTTGAGVAVLRLAGTPSGARVVYVESLTRIEHPSLSCRLIAPRPGSTPSGPSSPRRCLAPATSAASSPGRDLRHRRDERGSLRPPAEALEGLPPAPSSSSSTAPRRSARRGQRARTTSASRRWPRRWRKRRPWSPTRSRLGIDALLNGTRPIVAPAATVRRGGGRPSARVRPARKRGGVRHARRGHGHAGRRRSPNSKSRRRRLRPDDRLVADLRDFLADATGRDGRYSM